jgi:uncharacterized protein (UPF0548 family)
VRILTTAHARQAPFDCEGWSTLAPNATREEVSAGGFQHDIYDAPFKGDFERAVESLLEYRIFPSHRMVAHVCTLDRRVALGATHVQRVVLGPVAIETAVRVIEMQRDLNGARYAYATLQGHFERGIASFALLRTGGRMMFEAQAWSRAGSWLTVAGRPLSRALQRAFTREAVEAFCAKPNQGRAT